jgi:hypothetical protein
MVRDALGHLLVCGTGRGQVDERFAEIRAEEFREAALARPCATED